MKAVRGNRRAVLFAFAAAVLLAAGAALLAWKLAAGDGLNGEVTFGVLAPSAGGGDLSTRGADLVDGAELAASELNDEGGVLGRRVTLEIAGDACSPAVGSRAAKALVAAGVAGVLGGTCDGAAAREVATVDGGGIPFLVTTANRADLTGRARFAYLMNGTVHQQALSASYWMNYRRAQRLAIVGDSSSNSGKLAKEVILLIDQAPRLVSLQTVPVGKTNLETEAKAALHSSPDFVYWTGSASGGGALLKALRRRGFTGTFTASAESESPDFLAAAGGAADGAFVTATARPRNLPNAAGWRRRFRDTYHHAPGLDALQAYDAVRALAQAARQAGALDGEAVGAKLPLLSDRARTFMGPQRFARDHTLLYDNRVILVVRNGGFAWQRSLRTDAIQG